MSKNRTRLSGFTLIELSIVLVIIGLIVGGVLVGQDLIRAASVRATISQIEKYNTAINTFRGKYNALPGDIPDPAASSFGFVARGGYGGQGDGNGIIEGTSSPTGGVCNVCQQGETTVFWVDLSTAHLIEGQFTAALPTGLTFAPITSSTAPSLDSFFPPAKLGQSNYFYVYPVNGLNYFALSAISQLSNGGYTTSSAGLTVSQAYAIDSKTDDGFPQTGNVIAQYENTSVYTGGFGWAGTAVWGASPYTTATAGASSSCFDNSSVASGTPGVDGTPQHYSVEIGNGAIMNCALSFRFQ